MTENIKVANGYVGRRFLAALIDYSMQLGIFYALALNLGEPNDDGGYSLPGSLGLLPLLFWMILIVGMEQLTGATFGNGIMGLKPVTLSGGKPTFVQYFKRHLVDMIDMFFLGLVGYLIIKNTPLKQRLGDLWAKTVVVRG